jgi:hypothetical protein
MISAVSNHGAASSAKRIISTAPMAKLGAIRQLLLVKAEPNDARSSSVKPVVPTTACTPLAAHHARLPRAASRNVKSTATSASASANASADDAICMPCASSPAKCETSRPAWCGSTAATSSRAGSRSTAPHTFEPTLPPAPNTPTRTVTQRA